MTRAYSIALALFLTSVPVEARQGPPAISALTVVRTGPSGELATTGEANEVRIVFSEPMVALGRIPAVVRARFFSISPAVAGTFRWSGQTILIFTPDPKRPLPYATRFEVTIDTTATALSGRRLARPVTFRFTTPTVRLLETTWYRRGGNVANNLVVLLRFNQPVRGNDISAHTTAALQPHAWTAPAFTPDEQAKLRAIDPQTLERFAEKVQATRAVARATTAIELRRTSDWDKKRYPAAPELVAFETVTPVQPESWVRIAVDPDVPSPDGAATPGRVQTYTIEAERAFFVDGFRCRTACNPDAWNPIQLRSEVDVKAFAAALSITDVTTTPGQPVSRSTTPSSKPRDLDRGEQLTVEDAGFAAQPPVRTYAVQARADLKSADGQTLGYTWLGTVDTWHRPAFTSFGDGHGVWEKDGGAVLPFYARNFRDVKQWIAPLATTDLMPTLVRLQKNNFNEAPDGEGTPRRLPVTPDRIQSHGLDMSSALKPNGTGIVWAAIRELEPIPLARRYAEDGVGRIRASIVQVTNLGISIKDSPENTLIFVTRLDTGAPVAGATVSLVRLDNSTYWRGTTGTDGIAVAPDTPLRNPDRWWQFAFIATAEKDGDFAYAGSDWNEGITPWEFGTGVNLSEAAPLLRGSVFADRGVYRLGEEVHLKAILRENTPSGVRLLQPGTSIFITIRDGQNRRVDERVVKVSGWSSADWTVTLPADGTLGTYSIRAILDADRPKPRTPEARGARADAPDPGEDDYVAWGKTVRGSFLVAAYRRPDFRVDVTLKGGSAIAGDQLAGTVTARYLFGAPMGARPVTWRYTKSPAYGAPEAITNTYTSDRWLFVGWPDDERPESGDIRSDETTLSKSGTLPLKLDTTRGAGIPYVYTLEGDVEDVSRQHIANRAALTVHPAPWYIGVRRPPYFLEQKNGLETAIVAVALDGTATAGVPVEVKLTQIQWQSVRRAEGNGFYTWDTERKEVPAGSWTITTASEPAPLKIPFASGGYFVLEATGTSADGRSAVTRTSFYVLGDGYTAWARYDHNRIDLVPERKAYKPGETARIMIQSPWEQATALVTTEREGIRTYKEFRLTSTQQSFSIPITDNDIPNVYVSVLLVKGRSTTPPEPAAAASASEDASDPGKPSFRLGYVELAVDDESKRLTVAVSANQEEYRPAKTATVTVQVRDQQQRGTASEVTLWAVDYGVLSLTDYRTPDVLGSVYVRKALQVLNADSRERIVSRRVLTPKGSTDGGGGGADAGAGTLRKDFRVLAFWLGSVTTDGDGHASVDVTLPESLTTYRIMAVAADRRSRFGSADAEVRVNKPITLKPTYPRFLAVGDTAMFGAVVTSQLPAPGTATVTMKSLDPSVLGLTGPATQTIAIGAGGSVEARFAAAGRTIGRARVQMTVSVGTETDAFQDVIPVEILASPETVASYGEAAADNPRAGSPLTVPASVVPGFGGLHVEMASTAMVGLGEGARYLVEYPYGCAEQRGSRALALLLAADLGDAFSLPGIDPSKMRPAVQSALEQLERFQCDTGGFAYWPGACWSTSPYLTAYLLHVFKLAADLKYRLTAAYSARAYAYLERQLAQTPPENEAWWPSYTAWQAFAVKVLVEGGRNQDSNITRLYGYRDRMPVFALAYLHDALVAKGESSGPRDAELRRRIANAILPEAGSAHVEELTDPYLKWFWNSNVRSTAIVLNALVTAGAADEDFRPIVRWMMAARKDGRWGNTQENALAMESLVRYYRKYEATVPDFTGVVTLGSEELARQTFRGRSTESISKDLPMPQVLAKAPAGSTEPLAFAREGAGTLFFTARLRYASDELFQQGLDSGIAIERSYAPFVETGSRPAATAFKAGDLVRVTLTFRLSKERRYVAVTDPLPAGFEAVESWFATTARSLAAEQDQQGEGGDDWLSWWRRGGFDHVERHDDRVELFATRLGEGVHQFAYVVRATTAGTFRTAPAHAEEMYEPEVFGRTATHVIEIKR